MAAKNADIYALETAIGDAIDITPAASVAAVEAAWIDPEDDEELQATLALAEANLAVLAAASDRGIYLPNHTALAATVTAALDDQNEDYDAAVTALGVIDTACAGANVQTRALWNILRVLELRGGNDTNSDLFRVRQAMADGLGVTV